MQAPDRAGLLLQQLWTRKMAVHPFPRPVQENTMNFAKSVLAIAAMALACGGAFAADDKQRKGFNDMDKNGDGKLSRAEAAGNKDLLARWKEADGDNDGMLSRVEYLKVAAKQDVNTVREKVA